jgi:formylmethanofuran dehydrogenase subunit E
MSTVPACDKCGEPFDHYVEDPPDKLGGWELCPPCYDSLYVEAQDGAS